MFNDKPHVYHFRICLNIRTLCKVCGLCPVCFFSMVDQHIQPGGIATEGRDEESLSGRPKDSTPLLGQQRQNVNQYHSMGGNAGSPNAMRNMNTQGMPMQYPQMVPQNQNQGMPMPMPMQMPTYGSSQGIPTQNFGAPTQYMVPQNENQNHGKPMQMQMPNYGMQWNSQGNFRGAQPTSQMVMPRQNADFASSSGQEKSMEDPKIQGESTHNTGLQGFQANSQAVANTACSETLPFCDSINSTIRNSDSDSQ